MTWWVVGIIGGSLGVAAILGGTMARAEWKKLCTDVPRPTWSVQSWASSLSAIGAVLATVLAGSSLPLGATPLSTSSFIALASFFVFLTVSGPFVFQCLRPKAPGVDPTLSAPNYALLLACSLTLAAVIGQLATLALLYWEIVHGLPLGVVAIAVAAVLAVLAANYFWRTVQWQLTSGAGQPWSLL